MAYHDESVNCWWDEARTPTRLGEDSITLYLARWQQGELIPWCNKEKHAWSYSSVSARTYWVAEEMPRGDIPLEKIEACKEQLPAKGKWGVLVILEEKNNGIWSGEALNEQGDKVLIEYTDVLGLMVK